jgi:hypothetical protein
MNLNEILENKELAYLKKKSEIQKSDFSNVLIDSANKALESGSDSIEVLIYEATISKLRNPTMFEQYKNGYVLNHSVGMRYIKLFWCYNSENVEYTEEKENWDKYYPMILNKEEADRTSYFWAVTEAKNIEGSAVVKGSNFLTPVLEMKVIDENTLTIKCAVSPCNILDSHKDVHIPGLWKKTISENPYDLLLQEHDMDFDKIIADSINDNLKVYTKKISIRELLSKFNNKNEAGNTTSQKQEPSNDTQNAEKALKELLTKI